MTLRSPRAAAAVVALAALLVSFGTVATAWAQDASVPPSACPSPSPGPTVSPDPSGTAIPSPVPVGIDDCDTDADGEPLTVTVEAGDLWFAPNEIAISSDEPTRLVLVDVGQVAHNLVIDELGLQLAVGPGTSSEVVVSDLPPGTYQFYCAIFGHRRAGMFGTLTVEEMTTP